jgi:hypothetical protein
MSTPAKKIPANKRTVMRKTSNITIKKTIDRPKMKRKCRFQKLIDEKFAYQNVQ